MPDLFFEEDFVILKEQIETTFQDLMHITDKKTTQIILTKYSGFNKMVDGFSPGKMFSLAANDAVLGRTLALNFIHHIILKAEHNYPVLFFTLDRSSTEIMRQLLCTEANVQLLPFFDHTLKPSDINRLKKAVADIQKADLFIDDTINLTISELCQKARDLKSFHNIKLIVIDYLQLMNADGTFNNRREELSEISRGIKALAKELNIGILVLVKFNNSSNVECESLKLIDLHKFGSISRDADLVAFLQQDHNDKNVDTESVDISFIVRKNNNGLEHCGKLQFYPERMEFTNERFGPSYVIMDSDNNIIKEFENVEEFDAFE
jgi:replicative DNA helicase